MDTTKIQLQFTKQTPHGKFTSTLYFTEDEWKKIKPEEIEAKKQKHVDAFIAVVEAPSHKKTADEIEYELYMLDEQEKLIAAQRAELDMQLIK